MHYMDFYQNKYGKEMIKFIISSSNGFLKFPKITRQCLFLQNIRLTVQITFKILIWVFYFNDIL